MSLSEFWESTPREVLEFIDGATWRDKRLYRLATFAAYSSGAIARSGGDLKPYDKMFPDVDDTSPEKAPETLQEHWEWWLRLADVHNAREGMTPDECQT